MKQYIIFSLNLFLSITLVMAQNKQFETIDYENLTSLADDEILMINNYGKDYILKFHTDSTCTFVPYSTGSSNKINYAKKYRFKLDAAINLTLLEQVHRQNKGRNRIGRAVYETKIRSNDSIKDLRDGGNTVRIEQMSNFMDSIYDNYFLADKLKNFYLTLPDVNNPSEFFQTENSIGKIAFENLLKSPQNKSFKKLHHLIARNYFNKSKFQKWEKLVRKIEPEITFSDDIRFLRFEMLYLKYPKIKIVKNEKALALLSENYNFDYSMGEVAELLKNKSYKSKLGQQHDKDIIEIYIN